MSQSYDGLTLNQASALAGVHPSTICYWCVAFAGLGQQARNRRWRIDATTLAGVLALRTGRRRLPRGSIRAARRARP
jgi:hypothetical protein